jgi:hypothetical protein
MAKTLMITSLVLFIYAVSASPQDRCGYVTKRDVAMAATAEELDLFHQSIARNQTALFLKLRQLERGWISEAGTEVCIVEEEESNKIKIRRKGATSEMWTLAEAVQRK